ncbi:peptidoglycan-recognition protein SC2-like [Teleopsis dalmanni]|uniref:peptidoglycan-recognition protein SC2-like n=1 Tax=Teleopsis dalmanni TaxID=139649 RepID=UPI0018CF50BE|nr:peptidoglycan-recognition protein SC2-like [Teleopsis dalmanni]XP_037952273.1 peptidoglycan-recognition protein SC2-like [Teleopsis dalmanni]
MVSYKTLVGLLAVLFCAQAVCGITIISKSEWGGRAATSKSNLANGLAYAVIHHTADVYCTTKSACITNLKSMQNYHMNTLGWADIGYNFLIGGDGNIYEGRGWNVLGAHATNWNSKSIGISFMGNYNNNKPTAAQISAAKSLLSYAVSKGQISSSYILYGHRQVGSTECPGTNLYNEIKTWANWRA